MADDIHGLGPCAACGHDPACGFASMISGDEPEQWFCHADDHSCYVPTSAADGALVFRSILSDSLGLPGPRRVVYELDPE